MYLELVQPWYVLSHPLNCYLAVTHPSVFLRLSSLGGRDDPCRDPGSLRHFKGLIASAVSTTSWST